MLELQTTCKCVDIFRKINLIMGLVTASGLYTKTKEVSQACLWGKNELASAHISGLCIPPGCNS